MWGYEMVSMKEAEVQIISGPNTRIVTLLDRFRNAHALPIQEEAIVCMITVLLKGKYFCARGLYNLRIRT